MTTTPTPPMVPPDDPDDPVTTAGTTGVPDSAAADELASKGAEPGTVDDVAGEGEASSADSDYAASMGDDE